MLTSGSGSEEGERQAARGVSDASRSSAEGSLLLLSSYSHVTLATAACDLITTPALSKLAPAPSSAAGMPPALVDAAAPPQPPPFFSLDRFFEQRNLISLRSVPYLTLAFI